MEPINSLVDKVISISNNKSSEVDRLTWMVVHEYRHGTMPSEYDIKDIDEDLYLAVLKKVKKYFNSISTNNSS